ncbi:MAG: nucleotide sugar dehydrogenase [Candidatus Solibacter sp.]
MKLSIIGLGKLGAPMSAVMAHKGHTVVGVDINPEFVKAVNEGRPPVNEPGLAEMIAANRERLSATESYEEAILATDLTFIIVPTPSGPDGRFSMKYVLKAAEKIGAALRKKNSWHLVVLSSTVMPGCAGGELLPALLEHSGKRCPEDFGLCYNPEFIALGSVVRDMLKPDMILIGESDDRSGGILEELYTGVCESEPKIRRMNYVNAELTKLSVNTFVTTKISYANMLAQICETLPGADSDVVTAAIGCDTRIGQKYLKGALGYGGPCFPRDNIAFSALARDNGAPALLAEATDALNKRQVPRLAQLVMSHLVDGGTAGVLGLSYKPNTEVIEESQGVAIAQALLDAGQKVVVYDPAAMPNAQRSLKGDVTFAASAEECIAQSGAVVITTPWAEFSGLPACAFKSCIAVLDCWRVLPAEVAAGVPGYRTLGKGA